MKHYLSMIPLMLYPYLYVGVLALDLWMTNNLSGEYGALMLLVLAIICNVYAIVATIYNIYCAVKGKYTAEHMAKLNMLVKLIQIPAYIFHFIMGAFSMFMSVWGIGFFIWAILIDLLTICLTGTNAIAAIICCCKENIFKKRMGILYGVLNYIYCVDVVACIILFIHSRVKEDLK